MTAKVSIGTLLLMKMKGRNWVCIMQLHNMCTLWREPHNIVSVLPSLQASHPRNHGFIPGLGLRCISWPNNIQAGSGTSPIILFSANCELFCVWVKQLDLNLTAHPPSSADVKNEWSYISTTAYGFIACTRENLPLFYPFSLLWHGVWCTFLQGCW